MVTPLSGAVTFKDGEFIKDPQAKADTDFSVGDEPCYYVTATARDPGLDVTVNITLPTSGITDGAKYDLLCASIGHTVPGPGGGDFAGTINITGSMNGNSDASVEINTASGVGNTAFNIVTAHYSATAGSWFVSKQTMIS